MVNHHPDPELLAAFSSGTLPLSQALSVSVHLERCSECRANLFRLNTLGAELMADLPPQAGSEQLKSEVLAKLDETPAAIPPKALRQSSIPAALRQFVPNSYDDLPWEYHGPSIRSVTLCVDTNGARVEMIRIKPGGRVASHTHTGDEITVVLEGSFSDETGVYREGDFVLCDARHVHRPVATKDRECICLAVTNAPLRFTGMLGRLINPFMRRKFVPAM